MAPLGAALKIGAEVSRLATADRCVEKTCTSYRADMIERQLRLVVGESSDFGIKVGHTLLLVGVEEGVGACVSRQLLDLRIPCGS
jgi:hypothetical protein